MSGIQDREDRVTFLLAYEKLCEKDGLMIRCGCDDHLQRLVPTSTDFNEKYQEIEEHINSLWAETFTP